MKVAVEHDDDDDVVRDSKTDQTTTQADNKHCGGRTVSKETLVVYSSQLMCHDKTPTEYVVCCLFVI